MVERNILDIANNYIFLLMNVFQVKQAFLFGSHVKDVANKFSDIDIAVVLDKYEETDEDIVNIFKPRRIVDFRIEPHPFSEEEFEEGNPFIDEIKRTGIRIV